MPVAVEPIAEDELVIVTSERERFGHLLVGERPVAVGVIQIIGTVLKKDADRLPGRFANQGFVVVAPFAMGLAAGDIRERPDPGEHLGELVGSLPGNRPAQMPPLLIPAMALPAGSRRSLTFIAFSVSGRISPRRNRAYWSERVSYSKLRFDRPLSNTPGLMKTPTVIGISFLAIRLSKTVGTKSL